MLKGELNKIFVTFWKSLKIMNEKRYLKTQQYIINRYSIQKQCLNQFIIANPSCLSWIDGNELINVKMKVFQDWLKNASKESLPESKNLETEALEADLQAKIYKSEIKKIQVKTEEMDYLKQRKELISHHEVKNYYTGYLEKLNLEIFRADKKLIEMLKLKLINLFEPDDLQRFLIDFKNNYEKIISAILKNVVTQQQKEIEEWE
jgi:hypothetical protein